MKRATFTVLFYLKRKTKNDDGPITIYARVTVNGQRVEFSLNKTIDKDEWNQQKGCVLGYTNPAKEMNAHLEFIKHKLYGYKLMFEQEGKEVTAVGLKNAYLGIEENPRTILGIFSEHNEWCKSLINIDFAKGTWERYESCYRHVNRFIEYRYKKSDLPLREVSPMFVRDFEHYLKTERKCRHNTTTKYLLDRPLKPC